MMDWMFADFKTDIDGIYDNSDDDNYSASASADVDTVFLSVTFLHCVFSNVS